jgi:hypothetical protein
MEPGGKGSFQAAKLQRSGRTTVCSHSTRDITAKVPIKLKNDINDSRDQHLSNSAHINRLAGFVIAVDIPSHDARHAGKDRRSG